MKTNNPFLPGFSSKLQGRARRRQLELVRRARQEAREASLNGLAALFADILPVEWLDGIATDARRRFYTQVTVFWAWTSQIFKQNESCAEAVNEIQRWHDRAGLEAPKFDTSSYCKARIKMPDEFLDQIHARIEDHAGRHVGADHLWCGHRVKAIDGTSVKLMDTPANQAEFPQPGSQKPGCGFPVMGVVGVLDLGRGTWSELVTCPYRQHDIRGFYQLAGTFRSGEVVVGDRAFCSFEMIGLLAAREVGSVMRVHQRRDAKAGWRSGKRLDRDSRMVTWSKPRQKGRAGLCDVEWAALPETMELRCVRTRAPGRDGKMRTIYLVTTLLDADAYPCEEIASLYNERWGIEVKIRDVKTTMGFEMLRVKTPEMARRSVRMIQLAYNLIKARQAKALHGLPIQIDEMGFKWSLDLINDRKTDFDGEAHRPVRLRQRRDQFDARLAERIIPIRPDRQEPRAIKARPKPYQLLTKPRSEFCEIQHRSRYRARKGEAA